MAEGTKVRVVRCPKCENLLPELPDYTVYQCGGCGAVLRAKKQTSATDGLSGKSEEERVRGDSEKLENSCEKGGVNLSDTSGTDRESEGVEVEDMRRGERVVSEKVANSNSSSSSMTEKREVVSDLNGDRGVETMASRCDRLCIEKEARYGGRYRHPSKAPAENWAVVNDHDMNLNKDELAKAHSEKEVAEIKPQMVSSSVSWRSERIPDRSGERDGSTAFRRAPRDVVEGVRFPNPTYPGEGPSNYHLGSYGYGEPIKNQSNLDGPNRVEYLEQDRAELLRKLDELKDRLSRSCDVADRSKERVPVDRRTVPPDPYGGRDTWFSEGLPGSNGVPVQSFAPDKHIPRPPYYSHGHESYPLMNRHDVDMHNFYPPMQPPNEIPLYGDPFGPQMLRRAPHQPPHQYPQRPSHEYFSGQYVDVDSDPIASHPHNTFFHQAACSCLHCYNKNWQVPTQAPPAVFCNRRFPDAPSNSMFKHLEIPPPFGARGYNPRVTNPPLYSREPYPHSRRPSELDTEMGVLGRGRPQRVLLANGNGRRCRPIAGGAPFVTCYNCFELLQLPNKLMLMEKNQRKMRCGACSTVMSFLVESKRLVVSVLAQTSQITLGADNGSGEAVKEGPLCSNGYANRGSMNSYSDEFDNSSDYFKSTVTEQVLSMKNQGLNLSESEKMQGVPLSSSSPSEDEESPASVITRRKGSNSAELPLKANVTSPIPGSPLQENFDYSSPENVVGRFGKGNRSKRSDQEKVVPTKGTLRQDSVKDASVATEMEVSFNEYSNQDSGEVSKEEDHPRSGKGGESFFAGLFKKSFGDSRPTVSINGQPIPDRLVKKAEKHAGPIHPGQYWYDFRAGFWGVMGEPCLGIIPPSIEEFNYPIPRNCAGGNTGVLVNGRELHHKDLDLLASRGLPTTRDKSYIIEISGRVLDEDSGEELDCLGKLAPTVEKVKHGFGMRVPRVAV